MDEQSEVPQKFLVNDFASQEEIVLVASYCEDKEVEIDIAINHITHCGTCKGRLNSTVLQRLGKNVQK